MVQEKRLSRLSLLGMAGDGDDILQNIVDRHSILLGKLVGEVGLGNILYGIEDPTTTTDIATHAALVGVHHVKYLDSAAVTAAKTVKLDDFAAPDDNIDLDASTSKHGLLKKLGGGTTNFLRADGSWSTPAGGGSGTLTTIKENDVQVGGADIEILDFLGADFNIVESPDKEINIEVADSVAKSAPTDSGTATPSGHALTIAGGEGIDTSAAGSTVTIKGESASTANKGISELATFAEVDTGADATRAVTPNSLRRSNYGERTIGYLVSDPGGDAITTGDGKVYARIPSTMNGWNLVEVAASLSTVSSSGIPTVQVRRSRRSTATTRASVDMLSTKLTIDASEFDSEDAATAAVINGSNDDVNEGDHIYIDIDVAGTGAKGLFATLTFRLP